MCLPALLRNYDGQTYQQTNQLMTGGHVVHREARLRNSSDQFFRQIKDIPDKTFNFFFVSFPKINRNSSRLVSTL